VIPVAVYRPIEKAVAGAVEQAVMNSRTVPLDILTGGALENMLRLNDKKFNNRQVD